MLSHNREHSHKRIGLGQTFLVDDASTRPPDYDAAVRDSRIPVQILRLPIKCEHLCGSKPWRSQL
jgi:hypothetical protein